MSCAAELWGWRAYGELTACTTLAIANDGGLHNNSMLAERALHEPNGLWVRRNERLDIGDTGIIRLDKGVLHKLKRTADGYFRVGSFERAATNRGPNSPLDH